MKKRRIVYQALIYLVISMSLIFIQINDKNNYVDAELILSRGIDCENTTRLPYIDFEGVVKQNDFETYINFEIQYEDIPYETELVYNSKLLEGTNNLLQQGVLGKKKYIYEQAYSEDGTKLEKILLSEEVYQKPINEIVEIGTKKKQATITTSRGNERYSKTMTVLATAYDLSYESCGKYPGDKYYGLTAMGTQARPGVVAVDPKVIPLGTRMYIESLDGWPDYGYAVAEDTGGAIKGNRIDLFMSDRQTALSFGMRNVKIYILE